jgi:hypothetical protein
MATACWLCSFAFGEAFGEPIVRRLLDVFVAVPVGVAVLYGASRLLGVEELEAAREAIGSRLLRWRGAR